MIRIATPQDFPTILDMYEAGLRELGETKLDREMMLRKIAESYNLAPCFLLENNGIIIGIAGLSIITSPWNGDASLSEYMFYVLPEHRNIKNLSALVNKSTEFASSHDLPLRLEFATETSEKIRERLFRMHNFKVCAVVGSYDDL